MVRFQVLQQSQLLEMKIFMAGSTRLRYFAASTQGKHGSTRFDSTQTFYGSAFAASAAAPRSTVNTSSPQSALDGITQSAVIEKDGYTNTISFHGLLGEARNCTPCRRLEDNALLTSGE